MEYFFIFLSFWDYGKCQFVEQQGCWRVRPVNNMFTILHILLLFIRQRFKGVWLARTCVGTYPVQTITHSEFPSFIHSPIVLVLREDPDNTYQNTESHVSVKQS